MADTNTTNITLVLPEVGANNNAWGPKLNQNFTDIDAEFAIYRTGMVNKIINGDFNVWTRALSQTATGYGSDDRWMNNNVGSTKSHTIQTFTLGQTAVPGNPRYFSRTVVTSVAGAGNYTMKSQRIEDVRTFQGKTATVSWWAKADASKPMSIDLVQNFGTGGSPSTGVSAIGATKVNLTTNWQKFSVAVSMPSITGKTLGSNNNDNVEVRFWFEAGSNFNAHTGTLGQRSGTFDIAHISVCEGDLTNHNDPFFWRSFGEEMMLCRRYYRHTAFRSTGTSHVAGDYFTVPVFSDDMRIPNPAVGVAVDGVNSNNYTAVAASAPYQISWQSVAAAATVLAGTFVQDSEL